LRRQINELAAVYATGEAMVLGAFRVALR